MRRAAIRSTSEGARAREVEEWGCGGYAAGSCAVRPTRRRRRLHADVSAGMQRLSERSREFARIFVQRAVRRRRSDIRSQRPRPHPDRPTLSFSVAVTSQEARGCRLKRGLFAAKHIVPSQRRGGRARAQAFMLMAAPIGAIQAESQRAAAAAQPLCARRLFWSGAELRKMERGYG